jgi:hypothetical protein
MATNKSIDVSKFAHIDLQMARFEDERPFLKREEQCAKERARQAILRSVHKHWRDRPVHDEFLDG